MTTKKKPAARSANKKPSASSRESAAGSGTPQDTTVRPPEHVPPDIMVLLKPYLDTMREAERHVNEILSAYSADYREQRCVFKQGLLIYGTDQH